VKTQKYARYGVGVYVIADPFKRLCTVLSQPTGRGATSATSMPDLSRHHEPTRGSGPHPDRRGPRRVRRPRRPPRARRWAPDPRRLALPPWWSRPPPLPAVLRFRRPVPDAHGNAANVAPATNARISQGAGGELSHVTCITY